MRSKPRLFSLLHRAQRLTHLAAERETLAALGVTPVQLGLLYALDCDGPVPMSAAGRLLDLSPAALTGLVDRMVHAGLVERRPSASDRRAVDLVPTARGCEIRDHSRKLLDRFNAMLTQGLTADEQAVVARFLEGLVARFGEGLPTDTATGETHVRTYRR